MVLIILQLWHTSQGISGGKPIFEVTKTENNSGAFILSSNELVKWSVEDFGYNKTLNVDASKFAIYYPNKIKPDSEGYIQNISLQFIQNQLPDFEEPFR